MAAAAAPAGGRRPRLADRGGSPPDRRPLTPSAGRQPARSAADPARLHPTAADAALPGAGGGALCGSETRAGRWCRSESTGDSPRAARLTRGAAGRQAAFC